MSSPKSQNLSTILIIAVLAIAGLFSFSYSAKAANVNFTFGAWVKPTSSVATKAILVKDAEMRLFTDGGGKLSCQIHNGTAWQTAAVSSSALSLNSWQYAACVYDGVNVKIYIDGVEVGSQAMTEDVQNTVNSLNTGKDSGGTYGYFNGFIDSVKIYPYARTAAQIKADYAARGTASGVSADIGGQSFGEGLSSGLVGYWKMDEASWSGVADEVVDASGAGNHGVRVADATTAAGKFGNGGTFDGTGDYVNAGSGESLNAITVGGSYSISMWFNALDTASSRQLIGKTISSSDRMSIFISSGTLRAGHYDGVSYFGAKSGSVSVGSWYHMVYTYSNGSGSLYLNSINQTGTSQIYTSSTVGTRIGASLGSQYWFTGSIDEVRIYNRALSPGEVRDLYNFAPGPVGWWKMDEKVSGNGQTINDVSGYGNTGTTSSVDGLGMDCMVSGKYGSACQFDGVDDYVDGGNPVISRTFTVGAWAKVLDNGTNTIVGTRGTSDNSFDMKFINGNLIHGDIGDGTSWITTTANASFVYSINTWYHIVYVVVPTGYIIYANGSQVGTGSYAENVPVFSNATHTIAIGDFKVNGTERFNGSIDDVRIYNYARTQAQILEDYAGGRAEKQPIGHWKFDEGYGTTANNSGIGGTAINGTLTNMASPATSTSGWTDSGKMGKGLVFDGSNDNVNAGNDSSLNQITAGLSLSFWMKGNSSYRYSTMVSTTDQLTDENGYAFGYNDKNFDNRVRFYFDRLGSTKQVASTSSLVDGTWYFLSGTYNGDLMKIYINGVLENSKAGVVLQANTKSLIIGDMSTTADWSTHFKGSIDDVKIYNYALTEDDIRQEYNQGALLKLGSTGTDSSGNPDDSQSREYCIPGDTSTCNPPVGRWDFNEGAGATVNDISGNANTGTWAGTGSHWTQGKVGKGGSFNGSDDYVNAGSRTSLSPADITYESWFKAGTAGWLINKYQELSEGWGIIATSNVYIYDDINNSDTSRYVTAINSGQWYHVAATMNSLENKLYLDGVLVGSGESSTGNMASFGGTTYFGQRGNNTNFFNGSIDQVRIYNYARTPAQIAWDYNRGKPIAHWKFDECQGPTANDASGNGNDGTITIGATGTQDGIGTCTDGDTSNAWYNGRTGKYNSAMSFDGVDDYVDVSSFNQTLTSATFMAWVKLSSRNICDGIIFSRGTNVSGMNLQCSDSSKLGYHWNNSANTYNWQGGPTVPLNEWVFVVLAIEPTKATAYVGSSSGMDSSINSVTHASSIINSLKVGKDSSGTVRLVDGLIDEVKIYNYALTAEQIKMEYNSGAVRFR